jgi:hypothetical protein
VIDYAYAGQLAVYCAIGVVVAMSVRNWAVNPPRRDAWTWQREEEAVLEAAQYQSWRNRLTTSHLPQIMGEMAVWTDERRSA